MKEFRINRRVFLKSASLSMIALGVGGAPPFLGRLIAEAAAAPMQARRKTLVAIFQRGAMDGLMAVPPLGDEGLRRLRPRLAMSDRTGETRSQVIRLDEGFGLHPAFDPLTRLFRDRALTIVHGVGSPNNTRSHFDAQDFMESGTPFRKGTSSGWLNRALGLVDEQGHTPFRAVSLTSALPRSLYGDQPALAVSDLRQFVRRASRGVDGAPDQGFETLYSRTSQELLKDTGHESFEAIETLNRLDVSGYRPAAGVTYPRSPLGQALEQIAFLIKSRVGLEVAFAESAGWDTHVGQGAESGAFANRARDLAQSIAAFWQDMGDARDDVVLMTMTEFGRTVHENGSGGTDHGRASCMFVLGSSVDGGKVRGTIPRLEPSELEDGRDLPVTIDFRSVFAEVAGQHFGLTQDNALFPDWEGERYRIFRG